MSAKNFIVIDWGSTNIRAFLYVDGKMVETKKSSEGVTTVRGAACEGAFDRLTADWMAKYGEMPVLMAGMVGSINGWVDAEYLRCPVNLDGLADHLTPVKHSKGYKIDVVPGICVEQPDNYNVIRGEEVQLVGALMKKPSNVYLMPGTHCKWVRMDGAKVDSFRTAMTGEMHSLFMTHSLVGLGAGDQETTSDSAKKAFADGLERGYTENNVMARLFEIRGANILKGLKPCNVGEYLSGLLIGCEIASMKNIFDISKEDGPIGIIASDFLNQRYVKGLELAGLDCYRVEGDDAFVDGILPIADKLYK